MIENLLTIWKSEPKSDTTTIIVPDGCRDLIMKLTMSEKPQWFVSSLYDQAKVVSLKAGSIMIGFRIKPGVRIAEKELLEAIPNHYTDISELTCRLYTFTHRKHSVEDALGCLASDVVSIAHAAKQAGVSQRSLQRLLIRETGRPPVYWMMLARIRRTARAVLKPIPLVEIANMFGYADQSHMNREFKRWFDISPSTLRSTPDIIYQLNDKGYD
ncbi:MAG: AraC family transcriptional regulator [Gammaproteobacteria bacterium]|nr:AraC family transcriptional regulator [Gammaproteobacteria bacterium]